MHDHDRASNVISFTFDRDKYIKILGIDWALLFKSFKQVPVHFLFNYVFTFEMQSKISKDIVLHKVVFDRFMGRNPMPNDDGSSKIFRHIPVENDGGQMTLTDRLTDRR